MSRPIDIAVTPDHLAMRIGHLVMQIWQQDVKIRALEMRVDELDPPPTGATEGADNA